MESKLLRPLSQAVALALAAGGAHAASITVTDGGDAGTASTCTLRQAIVSANTDSVQGNCAAGSGADTITFAAGLANSTITLVNGELDISSSLTIAGTGQTIAGNGSYRVMQIYGNTMPTVSLSGLTFTGGGGYTRGAGLAIVSGHIAGGLGTPQKRHGHGATPRAPTATGPNVTLNQVVIDGNSSTDEAGGLYIGNATVAINESTISGNTLTASGGYGAGGIYITNGSAVTITDSTISGNNGNGNGYSYVDGGIYVYSSAITITNSTISGNNATGGNNGAAGGISAAGGSAAIYDSTITGNYAIGAANVQAGGILVGAYSSTIATLSNSILAGNTGLPADMGVYNGSNVIAHSNLLGTALAGGFTGNGNTFSDAPNLGPLANNGGPTLTMKPNPGSPALGAGNVALIPAGVTTDQRGVGFARVVGGSLDLGSVEAAAAPSAAVPAPALSAWALGLLGGLLAMLGLRRKRQRES